MLNILLQMQLKLLQKERRIADKIIKFSKNLPQNNSETNEEEILRERFISPELRHKTIDDLRLKTENY